MTTTWRNISAEEAAAFIREYPRQLVCNFYMDTYTWHDFSLGNLDKSIVLSASIRYGGDERLDYAVKESSDGA